jgi:hypothetical protein
MSNRDFELEVKDNNQYNNLDTHSSQSFSFTLPVDDARDARIAQRKIRIEQNRLAKSKPTGEKDGIYF